MRLLKAKEISARVQTITDSGFSILLYKDARVDMNILDEEFGVFGWKREHKLIGENLFCTVSIKDPETGEWISKEDVGVESYSEKEKGQASDSFKRACSNIGIGRELYTAPFIWIRDTNYIKKNRDGKNKVYEKFHVSQIAYTDKREIKGLEIVDDSGKVVFKYGQLEDPERKSIMQGIVQLTQTKGLQPEVVTKTIQEHFNKQSTGEMTTPELIKLHEIISGF